MDKLTLIKKHVITKMGAQDEGFSFSPNGRFFYNIEKPISNCETQLGIYETETFSKMKTLFLERKDLHLSHIEFDESSDKCYILGFMRYKTEGVFNYGFIGLMNVEESDVTDIKRLENEQYDYADAYKSWKLTDLPKSHFNGNIS